MFWLWSTKDIGVKMLLQLYVIRISRPCWLVSNYWSYEKPNVCRNMTSFLMSLWVQWNKTMEKKFLYRFLQSINFFQWWFCYWSSLFCLDTCISCIYWCSSKTLQTIMPSSCSQITQLVILYSTMIFRYISRFFVSPFDDWSLRTLICSVCRFPCRELHPSF